MGLSFSDVKSKKSTSKAKPRASKSRVDEDSEQKSAVAVLDPPAEDRPSKAKKKSAVKPAEKPVKQTKPFMPSGAKKSKKQKDQGVFGKVSKRSAKSAPELDDDDEIITASSDVEDSEATAPAGRVTVRPVAAFEQGFVHPSLRDAVNSYWKRSDETTLFLAAMSTDLTANGVFFGAIYAKPSFVRKGGNVIL